MYGSQSILGPIIGLLIGIIVVFLICRELVCWYWKINKIILLMEEQNNLLKKIFGNSSFGLLNSANEYKNEQNNNEVKEISTKECIKYKVSASSIGVYKNPDIKSDHRFNILRNEIVTVLKEDRKTNDQKIWYFIQNSNGMEGWCQSENMEKLI